MMVSNEELGNSVLPRGLDFGKTWAPPKKGFEERGLGEVFIDSVSAGILNCKNPRNLTNRPYSKLKAWKKGSTR